MQTVAIAGGDQQGEGEGEGGAACKRVGSVGRIFDDGDAHLWRAIGEGGTSFDDGGF